MPWPRYGRESPTPLHSHDSITTMLACSNFVIQPIIQEEVLLELIQDVYVRVPALVLHRNICICDDDVIQEPYGMSIRAN
jgi:hypothetical protein